MTLKQFTPGEPLSEFPGSTWNAFVESAKRHVGGARRQRRSGVGVAGVAGAAEAPASCGTIEIDTRGGIHFRLVCGATITPWVSIPATHCNEGVVISATYPPSES